VYGTTDPLTGSKRRDEILVAPEDATKIDLKDGDRILLKSETGEYVGVCRTGPIKARTIMVYWPEANVLISRRIDPLSQEPDYNTIVTIHRTQ
jgi:anaerobic selenocysteine-containing dehydrogenase